MDRQEILLEAAGRFILAFGYIPSQPYSDEERRRFYEKVVEVEGELLLGNR